MEVIVRNQPSIEIHIEAKVVDSYKTPDSSLSTESENPVMNWVVTAALNEQGDKLTELEEEIASNGVLIEDLQNMKIDKENDDYYPNMAVGLADNLAGVDVVDSEINFRRSGGGAISDGVARIESIKGNSVVWNQKNDKSHRLAKGDNTNGTTPMYDTIGQEKHYNECLGHKIYAIASSSDANIDKVYYTDLNQSNLLDGVFFTADSAVTNMGIIARIPAGTKVENAHIDVNFYDLTQMFVAGNEPTTIEEFYARIPMGVDLNAYNEGEVIHMDVQSIESLGVNQWDEEWELGSISVNTGANVDRSNVIRTKNFIPVIEGRKYYYSCPSTGTAWSFCYDDNYNLVEKYLSNNKTGLASTLYKAEFTIPQGVHYIKFYVVDTYGSTYNNDICINLSDASINGKYFPHIKRVEDLSLIHKYFPDGMKSAGTAHDEIRYNKASGKWEKVVRIGEVKMKDLSWAMSSNIYFVNFDKMKWVSASSLGLKGAYTGLLTNKYNAVGYQSFATMVNYDKGIGVASSSSRILLYDSAYTDIASFVASLTDDDVLYYELAEPIVTELDAEDQFRDLDYQVWNGGTEKANAEGKSAPLAADITYGFNAIGKIKELEEAIKTLQTTVASL